MNTSGFLIMAAVLVAVGVTGWGLVTRRKSVIAGVIAVLVAVLSSGCAWYAWAESQSGAWTAGYALIALIALSSAVRQFGLGRFSASGH